MEQPIISTIVVSRDGSDNLSRLLESLCIQTLAPRDVIVVHAGADTRFERVVGAYADRLPIRMLFAPGKGQSLARNTGVATATGSVLGFLDVEAIPCRRWTEAIARAFVKDPDLQVLQGQILHESANYPLTAYLAQTEQERRLGQMLDRTPGYLDTLDGKNFAIRGSLIRRFRMPFDQRLESNEDVEFYWKLKHEGVRVALCKEAAARLTGKESQTSSVAARYRCGVGKARVKKLHADFWDHDTPPLESFSAAVSWLRRELSPGRMQQLLKPLFLEGKPIDALCSYPLHLLQRLALVGGLVQGMRQQVPQFDHAVTPVDLQLFVNNTCNFRCRHCFNHAKLDDQSRAISAERLEMILDSLNQDLRRVSISGGEPFLCEDLADICRAFAERIHVQDVYIATNGFYPARVLSTVEQILQRLNYSLHIMVSIDGLAETHNHIRQNPQAFERAVETATGLRDLAQTNERLQVEIQTTVCNDNFDELEQLAAFVSRELDVFQVFELARDQWPSDLQPELLTTWYEPQDRSTLLDSGRVMKLERLVRDIYRRHFLTEPVRYYQVAFRLLMLNLGCQQYLRRKRLLRCTVGQSMITIFENYDVSICVMARPLGNLAEYDFDLKRLLEQRLDGRTLSLRDECYCTNSCHNSSSILTARSFDRRHARQWN